MAEFIPAHGGDILAASDYYQIPLEKWIDLSTGINPYAYPMVELAASAFQSLPYLQPEFIQAACQYYGVDSLVPVAGTQCAIEHLPGLLGGESVLLPGIGYQEHQKSWQSSQLICQTYPAMDYQQAVQSISSTLEENNRQHLVIINPNNPSGLFFHPKLIMEWAQQLSEGYYVIVDEAFIDVTPESSVLVQNQMPENIIVLRSFGKFFGLAGLRLGFVIATERIQKDIERVQGLWSINGVAQAVAKHAFKNQSWQIQNREQLNNALLKRQESLSSLLSKLKPLYDYHHPLFSSLLLPSDTVSNVADYFARQGILMRHIDINNRQAILRMGAFPADNNQLSRLNTAITQYS